MDEYELLNKFQRFALDYKISLIFLHHTRKMKANNVFDEISGTRGISGSADANFVLEKNKYTGLLYIQGRDLEDQKYDLELEVKSLTWTFKGLSNTIDLTPEQQSILDAFDQDYEKELKPSEIAKIIGKEDTNIRPTISKIHSLGLLVQDSYGKYKMATIN
jgi:RecA-family ATPase